LLFGIAVGLRGNVPDYIIIFSYFFLNIVFLTFKGVGFLVTRPLRFLLFGVDLAIAGYMMMRTGGLHSALYPLLFIPVLIAVLRFRYPGVLIWCSLMAAMTALVAVLSGTLEISPLVTKIGCLYLAGIVGGYLINCNFMVTEEVSKRLTRWNIELQRLNNFSHQVIGGSDLHEIFEQTLKTVQQNCSFPMAAILIFDEDELLRIHANRGWDNKWLQSYETHSLSKESEFLAGIVGYRTPALCADIKKHKELIKVFTDTPVESLHAFPLVAREEHDEVVGILMVSSPAVRVMQEQEYSILAGIANQTSIALQNATSLYTEQAKAYTDDLTGIYNRRYFNEQIENSNIKGGKTNLSLILLDIDDFKQYNDTYGHPEGDRLLKLIAGTVLETVREQDRVARYGGEEFAVILKETNHPTAMQIAERIRSAVENLAPKLLKSPVTISAGVATIPDHAEDRSGLVDYADKSLYYAKNTGKNKVCGSFNRNLKSIH
jgi:diguanylate cyclase (GGDEF)-like protein